MRAFSTAIIALTACVVAEEAGAQATQDPSPIVQVGVFKTRPDGRQNGAAYTTPKEDWSETLHSVVWVGPCSHGAGGATPRAEATDAWRISGQVVGVTAEQAVVQLDWQRILMEGQPATSPGGSVRLTLRVGERTVLDSVPSLSGGQCGDFPVGAVSFEARFAPKNTGLWGSAGGGVRISAGTTGLGGTGGGGIGAEGSATRGGSAGAMRRGTAGGSLVFDVDLWLVHSAPNRQDEVLHQIVQAAVAPVEFKFLPIKVATPEGELTALVFGSVAITTKSEPNREFVFITDRRVTFVSRKRPARDEPAEAQGGGHVTVPMPGPDQVLSFEMPPLRVPKGGPPVADRLSVRVRITPVRGRTR
jgi:hypothetical protein